MMENENAAPARERPKKKKQMSVGRMIFYDLLAIAVGLNVFALFHHVLPHYGLLVEKSEPVALVTLAPQPTPATLLPEELPPEEQQEEQPAVEEEPVYTGMWGEKFADKFTDGEIIQTENTYQSANVNVTVTRVEENSVIYYLADVYVRDLKYLRSGFANGKFNGGFQMIDKLAAETNAIVAISGDHYAGRGEGIVVRDGVLYRETRFQDVCVLLSDGTMVTMTNKELNLDDLKAASPWQVWSFGPELLDDEGKALTRFNSTVLPANPRSAIGYVEPGHYYLLEVEGSRGGAWSGSRGMTMQQLADLFESLGCQSAYNLDGGRSVGMTWMGERISFLYGRSIPDIIYITDTDLDAEAETEAPEEG
ncbi:MAG: phosphodiester glycosidase family protein [Oscillospiraceae bacterium]|nr:phosphodiester glycosidase family protein [Oscillospiraceae bacterium]